MHFIVSLINLLLLHSPDEADENQRSPNDLSTQASDRACLQQTLRFHDKNFSSQTKLFKALHAHTFRGLE